MRKGRLLGNQGFVLITTMMMTTVLMALFAAYFVMSRVELAATRLSRDGVTGFYAAEAGLNMRAEIVRQEFLGYNRPSGTSPAEEDACEGGNQGTGDFACSSYTLGNREVVTYVNEDASNPVVLTIPPGERYQNLNAQEYRYTVPSVARGPLDQVEAMLELRFKTRLVPLFQFAAFYNKDLEILPGPAMTLEGPVHTNGDLYLNANTSLAIQGQVTTGGSLFRGRKNDSTCMSKPITVPDPLNPRSLVPSCSGRVQLYEDDLTNWNGMIEIDVEEVTVPEPEVFDPNPGEVYWANADLRLVLYLDNANNPILTNSATGVEVRDENDVLDAAGTAALDGCGGVVGTSTSFYNNREGKDIRMLEVDVGLLLDCLHNTNWYSTGKRLDDDTEGGLVFHFTVKGPDSAEPANNYGVRLKNAADLQSSVGGAPLVQGMTVVSDQALYVWGDYNEDPGNKIPAALMADSFNVLSNAWDDSKDTLNVDSRVASNTRIYSAVLAGTDTTGGVEGIGGQGGAYNGGLENYPRFHEKWTSKTLTYYGSFVSLGNSRHVNGGWVYGNPQYKAPIRDWHYDTDFNDAANLPPITPRFVYLRQELFVRDYEQ